MYSGNNPKMQINTEKDETSTEKEERGEERGKGRERVPPHLNLLKR